MLGQGCCQNTAWGCRDLILTVDQISLISPQAHCCPSPFCAVWSSQNPVSPPQGRMALRSLSHMPGGLLWGQGMASRQVPPPCVLGQTHTVAQFPPSFSRANSSQEQTHQQILGANGCSYEQKGQGALRTVPRSRGRMVRDALVPWLPQCPWPEAVRSPSSTGTAARRGWMRLGFFPTRILLLSLDFSTSPIPEQVV